MGVVLGAGLLFAIDAGGKESSVQSMEAVGDVVACFIDRATPAGAITTDPCPNFRAPRMVAVGQDFSADGKRHVIGAIVAIEAEKTFWIANWLVQKGQPYCLAGESASDLASDRRPAPRVWLYVPYCVPPDK
jgi:hypothetical protein